MNEAARPKERGAHIRHSGAAFDLTVSGAGPARKKVGPFLSFRECPAAAIAGGNPFEERGSEIKAPANLA
ncbi:hypothetical protein NDU88_007600 [Pleurodeles waltl]|uniref:Uncharacterized protein n=1 Tax=Pleurodeles waltl TaxID=8319 RepID=A0AAV7RQK4_PLEWA|nr:hypothetical protein NDU88_007600 [Pleurodeles waltl]